MPTSSGPSARVVCDSISPRGHRLTTIEVTLHCFVLAELNTHSAFFRNSASPRAIPVRKQIERVMMSPALPLSWPAEQRGMQGGEDLSPDDTERAKEEWVRARDDAVEHAERLVALGVHKSVVNKVLEPFMWHTVIVSATDWDEFWGQWCSPLAQPELRAAADAMKSAYDGSKPVYVGYGEWHLPFLRPEDALGLETAKKVSVARCARVSYLTHDGVADVEADLALYEKLVSADHPHASPREHVATPASGPCPGNFTGWHQLRHTVLSG